MSNFNWIEYLYLNQDLIERGIDTEDLARLHYEIVGKNQNRLYAFDIPEDFSIDFYRTLYPYLIDMPKEAIYAHYTKYGKINHLPHKPIAGLCSYGSNIEYMNENKNIFYFAPHCPEYDTSSGGYRLLQILTILKKKLDYNVYFFCNASVMSHHLDKLIELDIKTFISNNDKKIYTLDHAKELFENGTFPHYIFVSWLDMAEQVFFGLKNIFPSTRIIMDSVDVHWVRGERQLNLDASIDKKELEISKSLEKSIYKISNTVLAVTDNDKRAIINELGRHDINVKIVSNIYPKSYKNKNKHTNYNDIIFVGGFSHKPNIDAALSAHNTYQKFIATYQFKKEIPKLFIIGANPTKEILDLHNNKNIFVTGYTSSLDEYYTRAKVAISPISWGSGIKGKVCEAAYKHTCILTTNIGNEGINLVDGLDGFVANTESDMIDRLTLIYNMDNKQLESITDRAYKKIYNLTSEDSASLILQRILDSKPVIVSVITYNNCRLLEKCISSLITNNSYPNYKIIITDNCSTDDTEETAKRLCEQYPLVEYRRNKKNDFFIKPNNKIMNEFPEHDIVLINDDIEIISKEWLYRLYSAAYSSVSICASGGKTIYPDGRLAEAGAELYNDGRGRNIGRYDRPEHPQYNYQRNVGYVSGCLLYMRRDAINTVGIFDKELEPMYYEDSEWQYRCHTKGLKTIYESRCVAIHAEGSSAGTDISAGMKRFQEINRKKFIEKYKNSNIEQYNESDILAYMPAE